MIDLWTAGPLILLEPVEITSRSGPDAMVGGSFSGPSLEMLATAAHVDYLVASHPR
ncbi:hypothetical protein ABIA39_008959 [Nocardia sp. GAS34]|uniref:hypothetical protein n=1 Tax=unclassified Nocardia TaxID=2637762 RepID=UPI003D1D9590